MASAPSLPSKKRKASTASNSIEGIEGIDISNIDSDNNSSSNKNIQNGEEQPEEASSSSIEASPSESPLPNKKSEDTVSPSIAAPPSEIQLPNKQPEEASSSSVAASVSEIRLPDKKSEETTSLSAAASLGESRLPNQQSEETTSLSESRLPNLKSEDMTSSSAAASVSEIRLPNQQSEERTSLSASASVSESRLPNLKSEDTTSSSVAASVSESRLPNQQSEERTSLSAAASVSLSRLPNQQSEETTSSSAGASVSESQLPNLKSKDTTSSSAAASVSESRLPNQQSEERTSLSASASVSESRLPNLKSEDTTSSSVAASVSEIRLPDKKSEETTSLSAAASLGESRLPDLKSEDTTSSSAAASVSLSRLPNQQSEETTSSSAGASASESQLPNLKSEDTTSSSAAASVSESRLPNKQSEDTISSVAVSLCESRLPGEKSEQKTLLSAAASLGECRLPNQQSEETTSLSESRLPDLKSEETTSLSAAASLSESRLPDLKSEETTSMSAAASLSESRLPDLKSEETASLSAAASLSESRLPNLKSEDTASLIESQLPNKQPEEASSSWVAASLNESHLPTKQPKEVSSSSVAASVSESQLPNIKSEDTTSSSLAASLSESRLPITKSKDTTSSKGSATISESRLPSKKRKGSLDMTFNLGLDEDSKNRKGSLDSSFNLEEDSRKRRKYSHDSSATFEGDFWRRKSSIDSTFEYQIQSRRKLSDNSILRIDDLMAPMPLPALPALDPANSAIDLEPETRKHLPSMDMSALEHLDLLCTSSLAPTLAEAQPTDRDVATAQRHPDADDSSSNGTFASSGQRLLLEAIMMATTNSVPGGCDGSGLDSLPREQLFPREQEQLFPLEQEQLFPREQLYPKSNGARDRLESWGGMSDLSFPIGSAEIAMASAALQNQQLHQLQNPHQQLPGNDLNILEETPKPSAIPSRISLQRDRLSSVASLSETLQRDRFNSVASLSEMSLSGLPNMMLDGIDMTGDIQAFVAAAMASVGDQLADLAGAVESVAFLSPDQEGTESENSSVASPLIGAMSDMARGGRQRRSRNRPRSWSASSGKISVDYEAVAAAVDAAHAATGTLDLAAIGSMAPPPSGAPYTASGDKKQKSRRQLPLNRNRGSSASSDERGQPSSPAHPPVKSSVSDCEMERIRERARAAAGYKPPSKKHPPNLPPIKKRAKRNSPEPDRQNSSSSHMGTPKVSNRTTKTAPNIPYAPLVPPSEASSKASSKGQANQKWESMFECLLGFINDRREEETKTMTDEEKNMWVWDGNVPTTYKAKDGKAIGRWVNNQRSAKSKGSLKEEREHRLVDAGLKWSVLASNSWNEMLEELRIYVQDTTKQGIKWDGNVPTNYQIKTRPNGRFAGEDKNLGRWVNRQRSLFQAGKLRKDRQLSLEKLGLKWSMLATTSWDSMYETLCDYVEEKKREGGDWDGNVPANFRTNENPPRALGRWINRQRSAFMKNKLKKEYMEKLNTVGLKWSVHERSERSKSEGQGDDFDDMDDDDYEDGDSVGADLILSGEPSVVKEESSSGKENAEAKA
jgi:hypothetical protein